MDKLIIKCDDTILGLQKPVNCDDCYFECDCDCGEHIDGYIMQKPRPNRCPIENMEVKQEWISVNEELPEDAVRVIILIEDDSGDRPFYDVNMGWKSGNLWVCDNDVVFGEVIAWQKMPGEPDMEKIKLLKQIKKRG